MLQRAEIIEKYKIEGKDGEIGKVKEFYFDDRFWAVRYLVADTGNWLTGRQVLLSPYSLGGINEKEKSIVVNLTGEQIENSPAIEEDKPVSHQYEKAFFSYYGLPAYWHGAYTWGAHPILIREHELEKEKQEQLKEQEEWDPNLRNTIDVRGHHIKATDGEIGHVEDFIIDDETWEIRYLIIDTKNWWGGKKILISPWWIDRISWREERVFVNLLRGVIEQAPEFEENKLPSREYEIRLHQHYGKKGYWEDDGSFGILAR